jgi:hypothetical protein
LAFALFVNEFPCVYALEKERILLQRYVFAFMDAIYSESGVVMDEMNKPNLWVNSTTNSSWRNQGTGQKTIEADPLFWVMLLLVSFVLSVGIGVCFIKPTPRRSEQVSREVQKIMQHALFLYFERIDATAP